MTTEEQKAANRKRVAAFYQRRAERMRVLAESERALQTLAAALRNAQTLGVINVKRPLPANDVACVLCYADAITPRRKDVTKPQKKAIAGTPLAGTTARRKVRGIRVPNEKSRHASPDAAPMPDVCEKAL